MQKSKMDVPRGDFNPQMEGVLIISTNLKTGLILQFPIKKKSVRIGAPKKGVCIAHNLKSFYIS